MRFRRRLRSRARRGFAMLELILALAVIGVVVAGVIVLFQQSSESVKRGDALNLVSNIRGGAERAFVGSATYAGLTLQMLYERGAIPDSAFNGTSFEHPFGDEVNVWPGGKFFAVGFRALDDAACEEIAGSYVGQTRARQGIVDAMVRRTLGTALSVPTVAANGQMSVLGTAVRVGTGPPFTVPQVGTACRFGDGRNDLYFVFG